MAVEEKLALEAGDVLIGGTHGLFDMVWLHGQPSSNLRRWGSESKPALEFKLGAAQPPLSVLFQAEPGCS